MGVIRKGCPVLLVPDAIVETGADTYEVISDAVAWAKRSDWSLARQGRWGAVRGGPARQEG